MDEAATAVSRGAAKAVNDAAFGLRKKTPEYLEKTLDRPMPFTTNVRGVIVDKAKEGSGRSNAKGVHARIKIAKLQASYLAPLEHGGAKEKGIRPAMGVKAARDKFGNINKKFRRGGATEQLLAEKVSARSYKTGKNGKKRPSGATYQVGRYFVGDPHAARRGGRSFLSRILRRGRRKGVIGLYERVGRNSRIRLVAEYYKRQSYSPKLGLISNWRKEYRVMLKTIVQPAVKAELRKVK
ncbi:hypothetical protein [Paracoccus haematequi]|nr:hypothetical protein [Paracoccus haematequi]